MFKVTSLNPSMRATMPCRSEVLASASHVTKPHSRNVTQKGIDSKRDSKNVNQILGVRVTSPRTPLRIGRHTPNPTTCAPPTMCGHVSSTASATTLPDKRDRRYTPSRDSHRSPSREDQWWFPDKSPPKTLTLASHKDHFGPLSTLVDLMCILIACKIIHVLLYDGGFPPLLGHHPGR